MLHVQHIGRQNRSAEGCSKFKVRNHDKLRRKLSQHQNKCKSQMGQDHVSRGVSVLCWLAIPLAMFHGNLPNLVRRSKRYVMVSFVLK